MDILERFALLEKTIKRLSHRGEIYYFANPGNWGDGLIRHGTLQFFQDIHLPFKELTLKDFTLLTEKKRRWFDLFSKRPTFIYGGGGGWCKLWNHAHGFISQVHEQCNVIVLPSTYETHYTVGKTIFFRRDEMQSKEHMPEALFCHDMAFYLKKRSFSVGQGDGTGYFFRKDKESSGKIILPLDNFDISTQGNHLSDIHEFFAAIGRYSIVHTDRLHVAIAACLLEREVHLYPGSYFKIRAVYLSSMKDYFNNITFEDQGHL